MARAADDEPFCLGCHGEPEAGPHPDSPRFWRFSPGAWNGGAHAGLACEDCHLPLDDEAFEDIPHAIDRENMPACVDCHGGDFEQIREEVQASVHGVRAVETFDCVLCHDPHGIPVSGADVPAAERVAAANRPCRECHTMVERFQLFAGPGEELRNISHDWHPRARSHGRIIPCVCCHTPADHVGVHEILPREKAERSCDACHRAESPIAVKFLGEPDRSTWVTQPILFENAYVTGAVRNRLADGIILGLMAFTLLGIMGHGLLRIVTAGRRKSGPYDVQKEYLYDGFTRVWHWINATLMMILMITGLRMHFGGREDPILSFEAAFNIHNLLGLALLLAGAAFFIAGPITGNVRHYLRVPPRMIGGMLAQASHYLFGVFRGDPHPFHATGARKFNPIQQATYAAVMYLLFPLVSITGILLLDKNLLPDQLFGRPGGWAVATLHYLTSTAFVLFLFVHVYLTTMGDRVDYLIRGMITGYHRHHVEPTPPMTGESEPQDREEAK
jgi:thiosulfate reductase cytochrome b subunit